MGQRGVVEPELFEYGIQTENSDVRAHVSVVNRTIYVFQTRKCLAVLSSESFPVKEASQPGVNGITARGWPVPVDKIPDLRRCKFLSWTGWERFAVGEVMSTSQKGVLAVECVIECMKIGRFPFWVEATDDDRKSVQITGTDIVVFCRKKVQVKCDWRSGDRPAGTGNLFLQFAERNPYGRH